MAGGRWRRAAVLAAVAAAAAGCGGDDEGDAAQAFAIDPGADGCDHRRPPRPEGVKESYDAPPSVPLEAGRAYRIEMQTSCGTISIALDPKLGGPVTEAVAAMVRDGFYDGLAFHRVVAGFVLQGGDPTGSGSGGPGFTVTQPPPPDYVYRAGDVAMAKTADEPAGAAGSQFFVASTEEGARGLRPGGERPLYAVVGHATDATSMTTIGRIDALGGREGPPTDPVYIVKATLVEG